MILNNTFLLLDFFNGMYKKSNRIESNNIFLQIVVKFDNILKQLAKGYYVTSKSMMLDEHFIVEHFAFHRRLGQSVESNNM